ncbi:hypothetical protein ACAG39_02835 [Caldicellulosiruptoraceae bacterium PP1]
MKYLKKLLSIILIIILNSSIVTFANNSYFYKNDIIIFNYIDNEKIADIPSNFKKEGINFSIVSFNYNGLKKNDQILNGILYMDNKKLNTEILNIVAEEKLYFLKHLESQYKKINYTTKINSNINKNETTLLIIKNYDFNSLMNLVANISYNNTIYIINYNEAYNLGYLIGFEKNKGFFTYYSKDTKRQGLIVKKNIFSILNRENTVIVKEITKNNLNNLTRFYLNLKKTNKNQIIFFLPSIIIQGLFAIIMLLLLIIKKVNQTQLNKFILLFSINSITYQLLTPLMVLSSKADSLKLSIIYLLQFTLFIALFEKVNLRISVLSSGIFIALFIISQSVFFQNKLQLLSFLGYHPSYGNRFYGIGNELFSFFLIAITFIVLSYKKNATNIYLFFLFIVGLISVIPYYFINFGMFLSILLTLIIYFLFNYKTKKIMVLIGSLASIAIITLIIKLNSYLYNVFVSEKILFETIFRKLYMNISYFYKYPVLILIPLIFILIYFIIQKYKINNKIINIYIVLSIFAFLLNDSGAIILTFLTIGLVCMLFFIKMEEING